MRQITVPTANSSSAAVALERRVLRALCGTAIAPARWSRLAARLGTHPWMDPEHRLIFDALCAVRSTDAKIRRQELPAQAVRMGFPDVDWKSYLDEARSDDQNLEHLIDRLVGTKPR